MGKHTEKYVGPRQLRAARAAGLDSPDWAVGGPSNRESAPRDPNVNALQVIVDSVKARQATEATEVEQESANIDPEIIEP